LGAIHWYGAWRQYCFYPADGSTFSNGCLRDIASFLDELNEKKEKQ